MSATHLITVLLVVTAAAAALPKPRKRTQPLTELQQLMDDDRKRVQQKEMVLSLEQKAAVRRRAQQLKQQAHADPSAIAYSQSIQQRSQFVCSRRAPPPSILDFNSSSLWRRLSWSSRGSWKVFSGIYDIFPILVDSGFRLAFMACSSCETLFKRGSVPRSCIWTERQTESVLQQDADFLYSCAIPKGLWSTKTGSVQLTLKAGGSLLQLALDSTHLPASLPCHPPYQLAAATMVWAFREMFKTLQWVEYHRAVGVQHFFIYDNIRDPQRRLQRLLQYHIDAGIVTYMHDPVTPQTIGDRHWLANRHAANRFGLMWTEWLWIGDVDEYLIPPSCAELASDVLRRLPEHVGSVIIHGPKFMYDERRWQRESQLLQDSDSTDRLLLDIELYTLITDYVPHLRHKSITRGAALLDVANHEPLSMRGSFNSTLTLNNSQLQFAHMFFHPWGRLPQPGIKTFPYPRLRYCYSTLLRTRLRFILKQLQLSEEELHWYQWGHQLDQLAVNYLSKKLFNDHRRRHPGGW